MRTREIKTLLKKTSGWLTLIARIMRENDDPEMQATGQNVQRFNDEKIIPAMEEIIPRVKKEETDIEDRDWNT